MEASPVPKGWPRQACIKLPIAGKRRAAGRGDGVPVGVGRLVCVEIEVGDDIRAGAGVKVEEGEEVDVEARAGIEVAVSKGICVGAAAAHFG